jgi:hypothetical protein
MPLSGGGAGGGLVFVDRGDPAAVDFDKNNLTIDGAWHEIDFSAIITDSDAEVVEFRMIIRDAVAGKAFTLRVNGNSNAYNIAREYGTDDVWLVVRGWWKPV